LGEKLKKDQDKRKLKEEHNQRASEHSPGGICQRKENPGESYQPQSKKLKEKGKRSAKENGETLRNL